MKMQETKTKSIGENPNLKPYVVVGVGVLAIAVSVFQLLSGAPGNLLRARGDANALKEAENPGSTQKNAETAIVDNIDSDSDGLTDTEEERIYHTDPFKPDSDGDSFKDGDEVKTGHDPLVNESGKKSNSSTTANNSQSQKYNRFIADTPDDLSSLDPTKYLSQSDINQLQSGNLNSSSVEKLSSLVLANTAIQSTGLPDVPDSSIIITNESGKNAVQQYLIAIGSTGLLNAPFSNQQEMTTYVMSALNGDSAKVQKLVNFAKDTEAKMKKIPVPQEMVEIHKTAIGTLELFQQSAPVLMNASSVDPQTGLVATNQLRVLANATEDLAKQIGAVVQKYGFNFSL